MIFSNLRASSSVRIDSYDESGGPPAQSLTWVPVFVSFHIFLVLYRGNSKIFAENARDKYTRWLGFPIKVTKEVMKKVIKMQEQTVREKSDGIKMLQIHTELCGGCRICELACSYAKYKENNPTKSRIYTVRREFIGVFFPMVCQQCEPPVCRSVCPTDAIYRDEKLGVIRVDLEKCNLCMLCVRYCPFGAVQCNPEGNFPMICDLCNGEPACVEWCPMGAIEYQPITLEEKRMNMERLLEMKRVARYKARIPVEVER